MDNKVKLLEKFGKIYINFVRDIVLSHVHNVIQGTVKAPSSKILHDTIIKIPPENYEALLQIIYEAVDECLHYTLFMLEEYEEEMRLIVKDEDGEEHSLVNISDGLCGDLSGVDGWIESYSKYPTWQFGEKIMPKIV